MAILVQMQKCLVFEIKHKNQEHSAISFSLEHITEVYWHCNNNIVIVCPVLKV